LIANKNIKAGALKTKAFPSWNLGTRNWAAIKLLFGG